MNTTTDHEQCCGWAGPHTASDSYGDHVMTEMLGLCGCYSYGIRTDLRTLLLAYAHSDTAVRSHEAPPDLDADHAETLAHLLDGAELIDHGTSIRGAWITDKGRHVAAAWREAGDDDG